MFQLIKNVEVFAPQSKGINDILLYGDKIVAVQPNITFTFGDVTVIDGRGKKALPGFIDQHVHVTGGGGEAQLPQQGTGIGAFPRH